MTCETSIITVVDDAVVNIIEVAEQGPEGKIASTYETVNKNLAGLDYTLNKVNGVLNTVVYSNGVTKTFTYTAGVLTKVVMSGSTPFGIKLTKTFTYVDASTITITYS